MKSRATLAVTLLSVPWLLAGCGDDDASPPATTAATTTAPTTAGPPLDPILVDLCGVLQTAEAGDISEVRATFDHGPLHTLADEVLDIDRAVAAQLLIAKEAVEADLADTAAVSQLAADLQALVQATAEALTVKGDPMPATCTEDTP